jgi:hypothetical protein
MVIRLIGINFCGSVYAIERYAAFVGVVLVETET